MGGCLVIAFIPILMGMGIVVSALYFALPIYAIFAAVMVLLALVAYLLLRPNGIFTRYAGDGTWRRPLATAAKWLLRFDIAFFAMTGIISIVGWADLFVWRASS